MKTCSRYDGAFIFNGTIMLMVDVIQVAIPVFEGLLEGKDNDRLMKLLFVMAEWHGLAKLKLHTDATLQLLDTATQDLGDCLRKFKKLTCDSFETRELQREADLRKRRAQRAGKGKATQKRGDPDPSSSVPGSDVPDSGIPDVPGSESRRPMTFNLDLIKVHFLGYYAPTIRRMGTSDSYSTQAV